MRANLEETHMSLMDSLGGNLDSIAGKFGVKPDQVKAVITTLESKLASGEDRTAAIESAARQHGISADKIRDILSADGGGLAEKAKTLGKNLFG